MWQTLNRFLKRIILTENRHGKVNARQPARPSLEMLEDRVVPAYLVPNADGEVEIDMSYFGASAATFFKDDSAHEFVVNFNAVVRGDLSNRIRIPANKIVIWGTDARDVFKIESIDEPVALVIHGEGGVDRIELSPSAADMGTIFPAHVTIYTGFLNDDSSTDELVFFDDDNQFNQTYEVRENELYFEDQKVTLLYEYPQSIELHATRRLAGILPVLINITNGPYADTLIVNTGGPSTITLGDEEGLDYFQGNVQVNGHHGDRVIINDLGGSVGRRFTMAAGSVQSLYLQNGWDFVSKVSYSGLWSNEVTLNAGAHNDTFVYASDSPITATDAGGNDTYEIASRALALAINDASGSDNLRGPNGTNTWRLTSSYGGTLNGLVQFSSIENLHGYNNLFGGSADRFIFSTLGFTGSIRAGQGIDTLDYSAFKKGVTVDLTHATKTGTGLAGRATDIENVLGGAGDDVLTGNGLDNLLRGNGGRDFLYGMNGYDILVGGDGNDNLYGGSGRDILIGSQGWDYLDGGPDDDILIGGYTSYDGLDASLARLMLEWRRTDQTYQQRIDHLRNGTGRNGTARIAYGVNVFDDLVTDWLLANTGSDWFVPHIDWNSANGDIFGGETGELIW
ncbi:MAG: M10 family metallopeptidase C-terminal domain-containing protein [Gemmataceae bacterium]|nr:M10 family metallopeptidase C-terminal domain-containing protein [Gemmataceae bacterium]